MHLITSPSDIYYLTGVRSHDPGEILVIFGDGQKKPIVFCDMRTTGLFNDVSFIIVDERKNWGNEFKKYNTLSTDPDFLTQSLRTKIEKYGVKLVMKKSPVTQKRIIKTSHEIELLRASQQLNKKVYEMILPFLIAGVTEEAIARKIQILQFELGATGPSFPPIVAFGENSAIPHHSPTERKLLARDIILLDMGLVYQGYCSDMTHMVLQSDLLEEAGRITELVTEVTQEIIRHVKPGIKVADLDKKARKMLGEYAKYFTHSLGHGVGIDIHEGPHISGKSKDTLQPGMVITIEPGIYIPGKYGARYEEMVLVTPRGSEIL